MLCKETEFRDSPIGKIPVDWGVTNFGETFTLQKGKKPLRVEEKYSKGLLPYLSTQYLRQNGPHSFALDSKDVISIRDDDLILLWDGSNAGEFFLGKEGILSSTMVKIKANEEKEKFKTQFLFYFLKTRERYIQSQTKGTGIPHVDGNVLDRLVVPIPKLPEQERIVDVLGVVDSALELADRVIAKTERLRKGLMQHLLAHGIGHTEYKDTLIGKIPATWKIEEIKDVSDAVGGGTPSKRNPEYWNGAIPWISPEDMHDSEVYDSLEHITDKGLAESSTKFINANSVLVVFRSGILKRRIPIAINRVGVTINQDLKAFTPKSSLTSAFLAYYLKLVEHKILSQCVKTGSTVQSIFPERFYHLKIALPPLAEQNEIVSILSTVDEKIKLETKQKEKLERLKLGLMDLLLTGKVRIKGD